MKKSTIATIIMIIITTTITNANTYIDLGGFRAGLNTGNQPAGTDSWTDEDTGEVVTCNYPQSAYASSWFILEQGFSGKNFVPINNSTYQFCRLDDGGHFSVKVFSVMIITEEETDWIAGNTELSLNLWGINYSLNQSIYHEENYLGHGEWEETNNIQGNSYFYIANAEISSGGLNIQNADWWWQGKEYDAIQISSYIEGKFTGELQTFNAMVPLTTVPEPATITFLLLGGAMLKRRK